MARYFINSPEFVDTYSTLDNPTFVDLLYLNVTDRAGDPGAPRSMGGAVGPPGPASPEDS